MHPLPHRSTLVSQVAEILRAGIREGRWDGVLPGETGLCGTLRVSRTTLRAALEVLTREGWLSSSQGRRRQVLEKGAAGTTPARRRVVLLAAARLEQMGGAQMFLVDALREQLAKDGLELELHAGAACFSRKPEAALERLVREKPAAVWGLLSSPAPVQRWFMQRGLPCVLVGSPHPGVVLPSLDADFQALGRHAAGQLLCRGHRRLAVLITTAGKAGDANTVAGFRAACGEVEGAQVRVVEHDGLPASIQRCLEAMWKKEAPTALLVAQPDHVLTVMSFLAGMGVRVPRDLSLISRDSEPYLDFMVPPPTRYQTDPAAVARKLSRLVLAMAHGGLAPARGHLLMPDFLPGGTLGHLSGKKTSGR